MGAMKGKRKFFTIDTENVDPTTSGKKGGEYTSHVIIPASRKRGGRSLPRQASRSHDIGDLRYISFFLFIPRGRFSTICTI